MKNYLSLTLFFTLLCLDSALFAQSSISKPAQPWAGAALSDWNNASNAIVITDLSQCQPRSAFSNMVLKRKHWKVIPYQMIKSYQGQMVWAPPEAKAPEVSLTLNAEGWFAIFVGLFSSSEVPTTAWIRLNTEPAYVPRFNSLTDYYGNSEEVFFRVAQLSKQSRLLFRPQTMGQVAACGITHVKLIPL